MHASVVKHFLWNTGSHDWLRHLIAPTLGFAIVALVIHGMDGSAKRVGGCWMAAGIAIVLLGKLSGRPRPGPAA